MQVKFVYAGPGGSGEIALSLPAGATIADAIAAANLVANLADNLAPPLPAAGLAVGTCGVWGKVKPRDHVLREGDRVELYRPLQADPKDARRAKAANARSR